MGDYRAVEIIVVIATPAYNNATDEPPNKIVALKRMRLFPEEMPAEEILRQINVEIQNLEDKL